MARTSSISRRTLLALGLVALVVAVALPSFAVGRISVLLGLSPSTTSAEAGYARDMQTHHDQGVEMAMTIRDRTDDEAVRSLAYDIATTQAHQSGQLYGWLTQWNLPQAGVPMAWMAGEHGHEGGADGAAMPGMATPADLEELRAAGGDDAERLFLTLMIAHHRGAVEMSQALLERSDNATARTFAENVVTSQRAETQLMERMLAERFAP